MLTRLTLIGTEKELNRKQKSITDTWTLDSDVFDSEVLLASIVNTGGQFEVLYADPDYFYDMCGYFWRKYKRTFQKWFDAFEIEYNHLENYDRVEETHEDTTDAGSLNRKYENETVLDSATSGTSTRTVDTDTTDNETNSDTTTNTVSAYDASGYSAHDKSEVSGTKGNTGTIDTTDALTTGGTEDATTTVEGTDGSTSANDRDFDRESHIHGNIGVTTSQQMLESELKVQAWSVYQHISDIFCKELLLCVY